MFLLQALVGVVFVVVGVWFVSQPERAARFRMSGIADDPEPNDRFVRNTSWGGVVLIGVGLFLVSSLL